MTDRALIIKKEWLLEIFLNNKTWELRSSNTKIRGRIKLIESKSGLIVGECTLLDSIKISDKMFTENIDKHKVSDIGVIEKWSYAWIITDVLKYNKPIPYNHPRGAVIWVKI